MSVLLSSAVQEQHESVNSQLRAAKATRLDERTSMTAALSVCNSLAILYDVDTIIVYAVNVARHIRKFCLLCMRLTVADILLHTQARRTSESIHAVQNHGRQHQCGRLQERESAVSSTRNHLDCPPPSSLLHAKMTRAIHQLFDTFRYFYFDFKYALQRQSPLRNCWTSY